MNQVRDILMSMQEVDFALHELFFSKTDKKGLIQAGNEVFVRVSEYKREELLRRPHNIVRHEDTPRAVFKLFWTYLEAARPVAAYVKNRSKSGRYYWVFAMAFPLTDGYLSIRLKPTSKYFKVVKQIYQDLVFEESKGQSMEDGILVISKKLKELGFPDYSSFMMKALVEEMSCRDRLLESIGRPPMPGNTPVKSLSQFIENSLLNTRSARLTYAKTQHLFEKTAQLLKDCQDILETCRRVKFVTLNLMLASSQLREAGKPLGAVAKNLQALTSQIAESSINFETVFKDYEASVFEMFVAVAISRFQIEMMNQLAEEVVSASARGEEFSEERAEEFQENCAPLRQLIGENFHHVGKTCQNLDRITRSLLDSIHDLNRVTSGMGVLHVVGKIEMARLGAMESLGSRLLEMDGLNSVFKNTLANLERECRLNLDLCEELRDHEDEMKVRLALA